MRLILQWSVIHSYLMHFELPECGNNMFVEQTYEFQCQLYEMIC